MGKTSSVVDPSKGFGLQATVAERLKAAYAKGDFTFLNELDQFLLAPAERRAKFAQGRRFADRMLVPIDRSVPLNVEELCSGHGGVWNIGEQDEKSLKMTHVILEEIHLIGVVGKGEQQIGGGTRRLENLKKKKFIRLDAGFFQILWQNPLLIPFSWRNICDSDEEARIYFDGTILHNLNIGGPGYTICLSRDDSQWCYHLESLANPRSDNKGNDNHFSAVLLP